MVFLDRHNLPPRPGADDFFVELVVLCQIRVVKQIGTKHAILRRKFMIESASKIVVGRNLCSGKAEDPGVSRAWNAGIEWAKETCVWQRVECQIRLDQRTDSNLGRS